MYRSLVNTEYQENIEFEDMGYGLLSESAKTSVFDREAVISNSDQLIRK